MASAFRFLSWVSALTDLSDGLWPESVCSTNSFLSKMPLVMMFTMAIKIRLEHRDRWARKSTILIICPRMHCSSDRNQWTNWVPAPLLGCCNHPDIAISWTKVPFSHSLALLIWADDLAPVPQFLTYKVELLIMLLSEQSWWLHEVIMIQQGEQCLASRKPWIRSVPGLLLMLPANKSGPSVLLQQCLLTDS